MNRFCGHRGTACALLAVFSLFMLLSEGLVLCLEGNGVIEAEWHHLHGVNPFAFPLQAGDEQGEYLLTGEAEESNHHISIAQLNRSRKGQRRLRLSPTPLQVVLLNFAFQSAIASPERLDDSLPLKFLSQTLSLVRTVFLLI